MAMQNLRVGILLSMGVRGLGAFKKAGGGLKGLASAAKAVRGEFALLAAQEAFAFMSDALRTFASFDHSMKKVQAVTAATGDELENLTNLARQLGRDFPFTASEAADAMFELSLAGLKVNEVMATTETVLKLAMAGSMGLAQSARIAVATMNAYGMAAEDITFIGDQLTAAFTNSAMTLAEVGAGLSFVGPVAKLANVSLADSVTTLGLFANAGVVGARSGTTFRQMLSKMIAPTTDAKQRMAELGLVFTDTNGQLLPMIDILHQLIDAQMTANDVVKVFGIRAAPGVGALINQGIEGFEELNQAVINSDGELSRISDTMESSAENEFKKFTSAMEDLKIQMGAALFPVVKGLIALFRGEDGLGVALTNIVVAFEDILNVMATVVSAAAPLIGMFGELTGWIARHNDLLEILIVYAVISRARLIGLGLANLFVAATGGAASLSMANLGKTLMFVAKKLIWLYAIFVLWEVIIHSIVSLVALLASLLGKVVNSIGQMFGQEWNVLGAGSYNRGPSVNDYIGNAVGGETIGDVASRIPARADLGFADGGMVPSTGWYKLHAGELVKRRQSLTSSDGYQDSNSSATYNLTVNAMTTSPFILAGTIGKELQRFNISTQGR
jgi:TP901 family phage tail tape measure protein